MWVSNILLFVRKVVGGVAHCSRGRKETSGAGATAGAGREKPKESPCTRKGP